MRTEKKDNRLIINLDGRIDSVNAQEFEQELLSCLEEGSKENPGIEPVIDMSGLRYISSAGLRVFLKAKKAGYMLTLVEVNPEIHDILQMTGFTEIFNVKRAYRTLSVEGCKIIGSGYSGKVYRLDDDTIVKVYGSPDGLAMIENEQHNAKMALVKGIPTAISYDIVKVGDKYGTVFELLNARSFNDLLIESPDKIVDITERFVDFLKTVHSIEMEPGVFPKAREQYLRYLDEIRDHIPADVYERTRDILEAYPDDNHAVHGDFHMKNVMLVDDEPMLIDMDTLCTGQAVFDMAPIYTVYHLFSEDDHDNSMRFLGIPYESLDIIWNTVFNRYYGDLDENSAKKRMSEIEMLGVIYFLSIIVEPGIRDDELGSIRLDKSIDRLRRAVGL